MSVASKNLYDLLGNDDGDSDTPKGPVKTVDKSSTHTTKRNTDGAAPAARAPAAAGARRGGAPAGNDGAFRDRLAGSDRNRNRPTDDSAPGGSRGGPGARVRGGRGSRFPRDRDDRHSKSAPGGGSDKQAAQSWGATEGQSELKDEQAGEAIAQNEQKEAAAEGDAAAEGKAEEVEAEPEDNHISYSDYLAQQAEKKLALESEASLKVRQANEGVKADKKWAAAKPLVKEGDEDYFAGTGGKAKRERERKTKQLVDIDQRYVEPERTGGGGGRGGRGGPRGGGRGDSRGGARGEFRGGRGGGRGDARGGSRGDARGGSRGDFRGGRGRGGPGGAAPQGVNPNDKSAFPSLGS